MAVESNNESVEAQQKQEEVEVESSGPLYTNSYDLCADILLDLESLSSQAKNAKSILGALHLWNDMKYGTVLMLMEMKLDRYPNQQENSEIQSVVFKRMAEIRNTIYQGV